jgi:enamine deaminase RidA (YjgF/YER057c/UK114 family)
METKVLPELWGPGGPGAHVARHGDFIFVSGMVGIAPDGTLVGADDPAAQTRQVLDNMKVALAAFGATLRDVIKLNVWINDLANRDAINAVRVEYFGDHLPAGAAMGANLGRLHLEMEAVAVVPEAERS